MKADDPHAEMITSGLNLIGQALSIFDADLRLAVSNRQYQAMFDLPAELTQPGTRFEDTIRFLVDRGEYGPQTDPDEAVAFRVNQASRFQPHYMERRRPDGRWIAVEGSPLSRGGWITVYTDITQIRRQESLLHARSEELSEQVLDHAERLSAANRKLAATNAALREAQRVLTETEARTRQVTEMIPAHIAHVDGHYRYTFSNRQLPTVFRGAPSDVVGASVAEVLGEETFTLVKPYFDLALGGAPQVFEMTHAASGGRIRIALTPDRAAGKGIYLLSTDVSAEVRAREALAHAARRNLAAQLTSGMAHDFGNLLTIILGLQSRLERAVLPEPAHDDVKATLAAARRGAALLERLSGISGQRELSLVPVNLPDLLSETAALARPSLGQGVSLTLDIGLPAGPLLLDPGGLQDALLNVILNADTAIAGPGTITLTAKQAGEWLEICVQDTGPGFSPVALTRAVEPFFSTRPGQGSGLGLSMVYDHIKLSGGTMRLGNTALGARVRLRLPWRPVAPQMILLAEDDDAIRADVRQMLTGLGHAVIEAASLTEARAMTDLPGLTMILSDLQLGDGSGHELAQSGLPCVLMTSLPPGDPARGNAPCPVIGKPFDAGKLALALAEAGAAA